MPSEDYFGNFQKGVDELLEARRKIGSAKDYQALSEAERGAQVAMHNLHMYFGRLSFWLAAASDEARKRLAKGEEEPAEVVEQTEEAEEPETPVDASDVELREERRGFFGRRKKTKKEE